ncbi:thiol reductant ABC exporter subunit CydC [Trichlorobacter ammonificans]|uniref:Transport ATP-binding protein CydC n=1 Tax=Trichlorobacter ammonificans TaxID=2916410 RepID=A0ABM9D935_9BACT|nr:thiol reductant ABC exporter subunit CydC [Trichlorobacter ammonificans]CAH2031737.1 Transport ATP-binding protein CydC [Trichlorobacter ammonificans]
MKSLLRFLRLSRGQWFWMICGILLGMLVMSANALLMALSGWFIASMAVAGASGTAFNFFFPSAGIRFLAIVRTVGRYAERLVTHGATFRILASLRVWLFNRLAPLAPAALERHAGGDVAGRLRADVDALENLYLRILAPLVTGWFTLAGGLLFLAWFSPPAALALLPFLVGAGVLLPLVLRSRSEGPGREAVHHAAELRSRVTEGLQGIEELILLGAVERQAATVEELSARLVASQERLGRIGSFSNGGMQACAGAAGAAVLLAAGVQVAAGEIPGPWLAMLLLCAAALFEAVSQLPAALHLLPGALAAANRIFELADAPLPVADAAGPAPIPRDASVVFRQVSASYLPEQPVLQDLRLTVPAGGSVVFTGPSGSGKSLLFDLLLRFRDYDGSILLGEVELRDLPKDALRTMITALPQRPHLLNGTIRDNLTLDGSELPEEALEQVLVDSGLHSWIASLPQGLDTPVGINGSAVSGGEARRIALARTLLKKAPIVLLDEPTEGLDAATEQEVVTCLQRRFRHSAETTLLVISHRPACLALGDTVVRLGRPSSPP